MFNNAGYSVVMAEVMMDGNVHVLSSGAWITPLGMQSVWAGCLTGLQTGFMTSFKLFMSSRMIEFKLIFYAAV